MEQERQQDGGELAAEAALERPAGPETPEQRRSRRRAWRQRVRQAWQQPRPKRMSVGAWILRILQGALIGGGAILPGISGGVLSVAFGIYQPMISTIAHPMLALPRYGRLLLPVVIGFILGFFGFAGVIEKLFAINETVTIWLFIGLIFGTLPDLWRSSGQQGRSTGGWLTCGLSFLLLFVFLVYVQSHVRASIVPSVGWFFFCGVLWGLSLVVPGMTSSSVLISMGLFQPMTAGVAGMEANVLLPMGIGVLVVVISMAKLADKMFKDHYRLAFHFVLGVVVASTLAIVPVHYQGVGEALLSLVVAGVGYVLAWLMERWGKTIED